MQEPYAEGLANHSGHESCAGNRKGAREALTVVCTGWVSSPEKLHRTERRRSFHSRKATPEVSICEIPTGSAWSETPLPESWLRIPQNPMPDPLYSSLGQSFRHTRD